MYMRTYIINTWFCTRMLLDDSDIEAFFKMTNENVRFCSPFSLHKNTTTF